MTENINNTGISLTDKQILDYIKCPNLFYIKYMSKIPVPENKTFSQLVSEAISIYFARLLEGKIPSDDRVKRVWDKLCVANPKAIPDKRVLEGWGLIKAFDRYVYNNKLIIADTSTPYKVDFGPLVTVTGNLETLRINNNSIELFVVECSSKQPDQILLDMSLKYTLQIYALSKISSNYKINCVRILHLKSGKEFTTYRNKKDFDRLEKTINNISTALKNEIFYPREDYMCPQCLVKNYCGHI